MADNKKADNEQPIIIKKINKGHGHHGGAWKVAYADFVTAMMAFFLLMWLLNVTTDEQKNAISNYFDPTSPKISESASGAGGVLGGLSMSPEGAMVTNSQSISSSQPSGSAVNNQSAQKSPDGKKTTSNEKSSKEVSVEKAKEAIRKLEQEKFNEAKKLIEDAIKNDPNLAELAKNLIIDMTPEGLRIQMVDEQGRPMFASGSAEMLTIAKQLISKVAGIIKQLPNELSIQGHTDATPYGTGASYTNWELSSDRANAARRQLLSEGFETKRINNVSGKADTELLLEKEPTSPRNRRISITLLKEELTNPEGFAAKAETLAEENPDIGESGEAGTENAAPQIPIGTFRRTPGAVEFP
jgi:chemotaxis protein MotB